MFCWIDRSLAIRSRSLEYKAKARACRHAKNAQHELTHYEDALRIGTTVLEERRAQTGS